jgi:hypothetical protein
MELNDFVDEFNKLYVLRLFDHEWKRSATQGKWQGRSAGGVGTHPTWKNNPQFGFTLPQTQDVMITLNQHDAKMTSPEDFQFHIGFLLLKSGGKRFYSYLTT